jgi:hypothetical protein
MVWHPGSVGMPLFYHSQKCFSIGSGPMMKYAALLQKLNPDADSLVAALSKHVDDEMLLSIANADYGWDVERHLEALRLIRDEQVVFAPMKMQPKEVLELTRWIIPGDEAYKAYTGSHNVLNQHIMRAFVCAVLLRAGADPLNEPYFDGENSTIAALLDSLPALEPSIQTEALRFFAWVIPRLTQYNEEKPFYGLALVLLILRTQTPFTRTELKLLINWIFTEVKIIAEYPWNTVNDRKQWLTWLSGFTQRFELWQKIGLEIATLADQYGNSEGRQNLKALARHLEAIKP